MPKWIWIDTQTFTTRGNVHFTTGWVQDRVMNLMGLAGRGLTYPFKALVAAWISCNQQDNSRHTSLERCFYYDRCRNIRNSRKSPVMKMVMETRLGRRLPFGFHLTISSSGGPTTTTLPAPTTTSPSPCSPPRPNRYELKFFNLFGHSCATISISCSFNNVTCVEECSCYCLTSYSCWT